MIIAKIQFRSGKEEMNIQTQNSKIRAIFSQPIKRKNQSKQFYSFWDTAKKLFFFCFSFLTDNF